MVWRGAGDSNETVGVGVPLAVLVALGLLYGSFASVELGSPPSAEASLPQTTTPHDTSHSET